MFAEVCCERCDIELYWMAGFFDGEGCITGGAYKRKNRERTCVIVSLGNTVEALVRPFALRFGGIVRLSEATRESDKDMYVWHIEGLKCKQFLEEIFPFLRHANKREACKLALEFMGLMGEERVRTSPAVHRRRVEIVKRLHELNKKGKDTDFNKTENKTSGNNKRSTLLRFVDNEPVADETIYF